MYPTIRVGFPLDFRLQPDSSTPLTSPWTPFLAESLAFSIRGNALAGSVSSARLLSTGRASIDSRRCSSASIACGR